MLRNVRHFTHIHLNFMFFTCNFFPIAQFSLRCRALRSHFFNGKIILCRATGFAPPQERLPAAARQASCSAQTGFVRQLDRLRAAV